MEDLSDDLEPMLNSVDKIHASVRKQGKGVIFIICVIVWVFIQLFVKRLVIYVIREGTMN